MSGEDSMYSAPTATRLIERVNDWLSKYVVFRLFGGGDDAEAHFVRRALAPSDVAGRQLL